jgi:hypothetical protein
MIFDKKTATQQGFALPAKFHPVVELLGAICPADTRQSTVRARRGAARERGTSAPTGN